MRPLIWKELRQGRPLLLCALVAGIILAAVHLLAVRVGLPTPEAPGGMGAVLERAAGLVLMVLPPLFALLAGGGLFAAEADRGTLPVLFALPLSRTRIWALKVATGLLLSTLACGLLVALSAWLLPPVYRDLPLRHVALLALALFATATFTSVLAPHAVGAVAAAVALALAITLAGLQLTIRDIHLLGEGTLGIVNWIALATPALLFFSARAVRRGELLQWQRSALLQFPPLAVALAVTAAVAYGIARACGG